ncbi:MAG: hypothetical protein WBB74_05100 [Gaiellaceae bacterium]
MRTGRPEPRDEFVASVASRVRGERRVFRSARVAAAVALTIAMLAALAPVGAFGFAASAVSDVAKTASRIAGPVSHHRVVVKNSPAQSQYKKKCQKGTKPKGKKCIKVKKARAKVKKRGPRFTG